MDIGERVQYYGDNVRLKGKCGTVQGGTLHAVLVAWDGGSRRDWVRRREVWRLIPVGGVTTPRREVPDPVEQSQRGAGLKHDSGKPQARLLHEGVPRALARVIDTLTFGAGKYAAHSWQHVENALERYQDASYRHDNKRCLGEKLDPETGIHHRAHHIINELFLLELELREEEKACGAE